jgi:acid phosphatase type 7
MGPVVLQKAASALLLLPLLHSVLFAWAGEINPRQCKGEVRHVHLAVGRTPSTEMIVSFASVPGTNTAPFGGVLVGLSPQSLNTVYLETEPASRYNLTNTGRQSNYGDSYFSPTYHHITIDGLKPSTTYYYKPVVHRHIKSFSEDASVTVRRAAPTEPEDMTALQETIEEELERDHGASSSGGSSNSDDEEEDDERQRHRQLEHLAPYDGSQKECPSPAKIRSFRTAPAPTTREQAKDKAYRYPRVNFAIVGDLGQFPHSQDTVARLMRSRDDVDSIILAGDIAYANMDHRQWDTFFDFLDDYPMADHKPMQIVPGNHDIDKLKNGREVFLAYEHRFRMPRVHPPRLGLYDGPAGELNMDQPPYPLPYEWGNAYYAYSYGPVHFVMISSYSSVEPDSTQYQWVVDELSRVDRLVTPWVVVVLHTPLYNTFSLHRKDAQIEACKRNLESVFVEHNVNLVFSGHIHAYLRTTNVVNDGQVHAKGPIHITVGAGGRKCEAPFLNVEPEPWVRVRDATLFGYGMLRVQNRTHAEWEWIHTGKSDTHSGNQVQKSEQTLPPGPATDRLWIENQYYIQA